MTDSPIQSAWLFIAVVLLGAALSWCTMPRTPAHADDLTPALAVARVSYHEAGDSLADVALVWQVTEPRGVGWLRRHSGRVLGRKPPRTRRTVWVRTLTAEHWPGVWPARLRPGWLSVLRTAQELVSGRLRWRPCDGAPITWGGPMDHEGAVLRGLRAVPCKGTRNRGYVLASSFERGR